jgi:hypothetical protein
VREDYSANGDAWNSFPHDHARSRAYRWGEDGLLGITDRECRLCFALALWNGHDPFLKERLFGLPNPQGNHGEDVKEWYWYLDSTPTHSYMRALYKYPQAEFPYARLVEENARRSRHEREFEITDTGIFDGHRYFDVFAEYAKSAPEDICIRITVANRGPDAARLHVLPTLWFRNTWSWTGTGHPPRPEMTQLDGTSLAATHPTLGAFRFEAEGAREFLFTENETNCARLYGCKSATPFVKDAFHEYVVAGRREDGEPGVTWNEGGRALPARCSRPRRMRVAIAAAARDPGRARAVGRFRQSLSPARRGVRSLLRLAAAGKFDRGSSARRATGVRGTALVEAMVRLRREAMDGGRSRDAAAAERATRLRATQTGRTCTTATSSRCPTNGNTPGTRPGIWRFT